MSKFEEKYNGEPLIFQSESNPGLVDVEGGAVLHEEVPLDLLHLLHPLPPLSRLLVLNILHHFLD